MSEYILNMDYNLIAKITQVILYSIAILGTIGLIGLMLGKTQMWSKTFSFVILFAIVLGSFNVYYSGIVNDKLTGYKSYNNGDGKLKFVKLVPNTNKFKNVKFDQAKNIEQPLGVLICEKSVVSCLKDINELEEDPEKVAFLETTND